MAAEAFARGDVTLANWRERPYSAWSFQNVCELVPSARIAERNGDDAPDATAEILETLQVTGRDGDTASAAEHLRQSFCDSFVAMRDGRVVAEWSAQHADPRKPHVVFSVSKSITGMLAGVAVGDGLLDAEALVAGYVSVRPGTAYAEARVRHLLDMSVSLDFEEDYLDRDGPFDRYRRAMLWNPERGGGPHETMIEVLGSLPKAAHAHGDRFYYASPNTDMMGLVIEAATGRRFHEYLAERIWRPIGARDGAYVTVDRVGAARAAGGICVTARDLARFGQLVLQGGVAADGRQLIPAAWIEDMRRNGDRRAWLAGNFKADFPDGNYRSFWYDTGDGRGSFCAIGIHGQWLWCDPTGNVVLAKLSSRPEPTDEAASRVEVGVLGQIARAL